MIQNKSRYIVSDYNLNYIDKENKVFFHSHICAYKHGFSYKDDNVANFLDHKKEFVDKNWNFVEERFNKYVSILHNRLNQFHEVNYSKNFWYRSFSLGLLRNISFLHMFYTIAEENFDPELHFCKILAKKDYVYCDDFESQRELLNSNWLGQEQLLSIYIDFFYPEYYQQLKKLKNLQIDVSEFSMKKKTTSWYLVLVSKLKKFAKPNQALKTIFRKIRTKIIARKSTVGILGSNFSNKYLDELYNRSGGRVGILQTVPIVTSPKINFDIRAELFTFCKDGDKFDQFFFYASKYIFPKVFVENFHPTLHKYSLLLNQYPNLKYIVTEAWLSSTSINIFRAIAFEQMNIKTLYNEHNCIFHPFVGSFSRLASELVDSYLTFGWNCDGSKFISLGSLYEFKIPLRSKKYHILYVSYPIEQTNTVYSSAYCRGGFGAISHLTYIKSFFSSLPNNILEKITYRGYPKDYFFEGLKYEKEKLLKKYLKNVNFYTSYLLNGETCKEQMASSCLVVIDCLSTAYIESLMMNIPTVCFWNKEIMCLQDEFMDYYNDLIHAKIIHTCPLSASEHLKEIYENPSIWWEDPKTQILRKKWLANNFGEPKLLVDYLLKISQISNKNIDRS